MSTNSYLIKVLKAQTLAPDGKELEELRDRREAVETLLCKKFGDSAHIRYSGSKMKNTMIRESYDLDIAVYFGHNDTVAGETLEEIFENVAVALEDEYVVERKRSALRLESKESVSEHKYEHVDVVPGRFIDGEDGDVFLYQNGVDKDCLKTNLDVHKKHIGGSSVTDAIRLVKLWKVKNNLQVKTFVLELLVVDLLKDAKKKELDEQLEIVLTAFRDRMDELAVEDPANPFGNELSGILDKARSQLSTTARTTLQTVENSDWEGVFGSVETDEEKRKRLQSIAVSTASSERTKPWSFDE